MGGNTESDWISPDRGGGWGGGGGRRRGEGEGEVLVLLFWSICPT